MKRTLPLLLVLGCTRKEPPPLVVAEHRDAAADAVAPVAVVDAGATEAVDSQFTVVARGPAVTGRPPAMHGDAIASADPALQRLPGGGVAFGAEFVIATAGATGPFTVGAPAPEQRVQSRAAMVQTAEALRWVWMGPEVAVYSLEEATMRTGPRIESYRRDEKGWQPVRGTTGYWSAVRRGDSVLALERSTYEIPHSSIYVGDETTNQHSLTTPKIAVLAGKGPAPALPKDTCATAMAAGPDGTLVVTVDRCKDDENVSLGVVRYAPGATTSKVEWLGKRKRQYDTPEALVPAVGGANDIWIADGKNLVHWDGTRWDTVEGKYQLQSLSVARDGTLWAVREDELIKRAKGAESFTLVPLPLAPADRLDPENWSNVSQLSRDVHPAPVDPEHAFTREPKAEPMKPLLVDATEPEVLVLGGLVDEVFVLSTTPRTPVARIPTMNGQRAIVARTAKHKVATTAKECTYSSFLAFPEETTADQVKAQLGAEEGEKPVVGEAMIDGKKRLVVSVPGDTVVTAKKLVALKPTRLCGNVAIERDL